jgi:D-amino-acid dehydrogenase
MKTLVLGGGVVGVTTAYFLAKAGHEVTILEEKEGLGQEATRGDSASCASARRHARGGTRSSSSVSASTASGS